MFILSIWRCGCPSPLAWSTSRRIYSRPESGWPAAIRLRTLPLRPSPWTRAALFGSLARGGHLRVEDADIRVDLHGTKGGAAMRNAGGSFYDFVTERFRGTSREQVASYPKSWGGRMAADWAIKLANGGRFKSAVSSVIDTAVVIDRIYRTHR